MYYILDHYYNFLRDPKLFLSFPFTLEKVHPPVWIERQIFTSPIILRSVGKSEFGVSLLLIPAVKKLSPGPALCL